MRRANLCPQIRLRAAVQGSDEALHDVHAALSKMVALLLGLLRMLADGDAIFSSQPTNFSWARVGGGWLVATLQGDRLTAQPIRQIRHTLRNPWCSIALFWNCHCQSEPILRSANLRIGLLP